MFLGNLDAHINVDRHSKGVSVVSCGKAKEDDQFEPYVVVFNRVTLVGADGKPLKDRNGKVVTTLVAEPSPNTVVQLEQEKEKSEKADERAKWLRLLPVTEAEAVSTADLFQEDGPTKRTIKTHLDELADCGLATRIDGNNNRSSPSRYYRNALGSQFVVEMDAKA